MPARAAIFAALKGSSLKDAPQDFARAIYRRDLLAATDRAQTQAQQADLAQLVYLGWFS